MVSTGGLQTLLYKHVSFSGIRKYTSTLISNTQKMALQYTWLLAIQTVYVP